MGDRRMISRTVVDSARFLKMPATSQNLYFHLVVNADDDEIVEAYKVMAMCKANEDDLRVLVGVETYFNYIGPRIKYNTRLTKEHAFRTKIIGDWGKSPQRAKLYKSTLLANLDKVVKLVLASGILVILETSFFITSFKDGLYHLGENDVIKEII